MASMGRAASASTVRNLQRLPKEIKSLTAAPYQGGGDRSRPARITPAQARRIHCKTRPGPFNLSDPCRPDSCRPAPDKAAACSDAGVDMTEFDHVTLEGRRVRLLPMTMEHHAALCAVGLDADLWRWTTDPVTTPEEMRRYIQTALYCQASGSSLPFVTVERETAAVVGSTRFANIDRANRRVEIGWTWVAGNWQRSFVNTEAKYLMLKHAFEVMRCIRVEFKTDSLNRRSRAALLRLGAREEGTLRNHMITSTGRYRHSVYYSIIDSEWPDVKRSLEVGQGWSREG